MKTSRLIWLLFAIVIALGMVRFARHHGPSLDFSFLEPQHKVTVQWTTSPGAASYNIYRTTLSGRDYVKVGASGEPRFIDESVARKTVYYYAVTAVSGEGHESPPSAEIQAVVP